MTTPIVFISHFRIKEGQLDNFRQLSETVTEQIKATKPGTVAYLQYLNAEGSELSIIHVFPDADAFDKHIVGAVERTKAAFEFIEPTGREVFGMPSDQSLAALRPPAGSGISFSHRSQLMGGYLRYHGI